MKGKEIKKHRRREVGRWRYKSEKAYTLSLYIGGSYNIAELECRKACFPHGLCVTIEKVKYIFAGGTEEGVRIGFIQYPPFPEDEPVILEKALELGKAIAKKGYQFSFSVITPDETIFYSVVK